MKAKNSISKISFLIVIISLFIISCGGENTTTQNTNNNTESSDFFPLEIGSWWKYRVSFSPESDDYTIDSTVLEQTILKNGKDSYMFVSYLKNKDTYEIELYDTTYFYKEGPKIYRLLNNKTTGNLEWMLYADIQLEYVKIYENPVEMPWNNGIFKGVEKMERVIEGPEKFYLDDKTINCITSKVMISYVGTYIEDNKEEPINEIVMTEYQWFGYKVGFVRQFWQSGDYERLLLEYNIPE